MRVIGPPAPSYVLYRPYLILLHYSPFVYSIPPSKRSLSAKHI